MIPELENLVKNLLSKGELTERSRELLIKKAEQLGIDPLDFELELEEMIITGSTKTEGPPPSPPIPPQNVSSSTEKKSQKYGDIKKCPSCGASVESFTTKCQDCGHEFRNIEVALSAQAINQELLKIDQESRDEYFKKGFDVDKFPAITSGPFKSEASSSQKSTVVVEDEIARNVAGRKKGFISSFPIPNTKEDILEILALSIPEATKKLSFLEKLTAKGEMKKTWLAKSQQIIMKARFSMKEDKKTLEEIEHYAKQIKF